MACCFTEWPFESTIHHFQRHFAYAFRDEIEINAKKQEATVKCQLNDAETLPPSHLCMCHTQQNTLQTRHAAQMDHHDRSQA